MAKLNGTTAECHMLQGVKARILYSMTVPHQENRVIGLKSDTCVCMWRLQEMAGCFAHGVDLIPIVCEFIFVSLLSQPTSTRCQHCAEVDVSTLGEWSKTVTNILILLTNTPRVLLGTHGYSLKLTL